MKKKFKPLSRENLKSIIGGALGSGDVATCTCNCPGGVSISVKDCKGACTCSTENGVVTAKCTTGLETETKTCGTPQFATI